MSVKYFDQPICGSPFQVKAWDPNKVFVSNIKQGCVGIESFFKSKLSLSDNFIYLSNKFYITNIISNSNDDWFN